MGMSLSIVQDNGDKGVSMDESSVQDMGGVPHRQVIKEEREVEGKVTWWIGQRIDRGIIGE